MRKEYMENEEIMDMNEDMNPCGNQRLFRTQCLL